MYQTINTSMSIIEHPKRNSRVSVLVREIEEKIKPPDKKSNLKRDLFRSRNTVYRFKEHKQTYMKKHTTTWYAKDIISDSSDMSSEYQNNSLATSAVCELSKYPKETKMDDDDPSKIITEVVLRSQYEPNNMYEKHEQELRKRLSDDVTIIDKINEKECIEIRDNLNSRTSVSDNKILKPNSYISTKTIILNSDISYATSKDIAKIDAENNLSVEYKNNELEKTGHVESWLKQSQVSNETQDYNIPLTSPEIRYEQFEKNVDLNSQNTSKQIPNDVPDNQTKRAVINITADANSHHYYENLEMYRRSLQKELLLIDNIEILDDFDYSYEDPNNGSDVTYEDIGEDGQNISEIQYLNMERADLDSNIQYVDSDLDEIISNTKKSLESVAEINDDEVDISSNGMFGEGNFTFKIHTSYWEVINPLHNKNAPEQFFNEINNLTSIPVNIAKYINNNIDKRIDKVVQLAAENSRAKNYVAQYYSQGSLCNMHRQRIESFQSGVTSGSDNFFMQLSDHHSSTEDMQNSPNLIRTHSKLVRVDQTYYNNTLRITNNVVINETPKKKIKCEYIVDELLETEYNYLCKLEIVRDIYIPALNDHVKYPNLVGKTKFIFLNWNMIYLYVCDFYEKIQESGYNYEKLAENILKSKKLFEQHSIYCKNKEIADRVLQEEVGLINEEIQNGDKLDLTTYLLEPVQRLTRYIMLLKDLKKELIKNRDCQKLSEAINMIQEFASESNNVLDAGRIKNIPFPLEDQGRLIRRDTFTVIKMRNKTKWADMRIFLFEKVLIIASHVKSSGEYIYKDHIFMDHMGFYSDEKKFIVSDYTKNKTAKDRNYQSFACDSKDPEVLKEWNILINEQLILQIQKIKDAHLNNIYRRKRY